MYALIGAGLVFYSFLLIAVVAFIIFTYNSLVRCRNRVKNSFAQIDTQVQRRFDLILSLVDTIRGITAVEVPMLEDVTASRSGYLSAGSNQEKMAMNNQLTVARNSVVAVAQQLPDSRANANFAKLLDELAETEDKVAFSRQFYNDAVTIYNNKIQTFPGNMIARVFGFKEEELFDIDEELNEVYM